MESDRLSDTAKRYRRWWKKYQNTPVNDLHDDDVDHPAVRAWVEVCELNLELIRLGYDWNANPLNLPHTEW
jgi:hypothetical protein